MTKIQFLFFSGCPNVEKTKDRLNTILIESGLDIDSVEYINTEDIDCPKELHLWPSPTILIDGKELEGRTHSQGAACRLYFGGAPSKDLIRKALTR